MLLLAADGVPESVLVPQLFQKYQMMPDRPCHRGVLAIRNAELFGGLLHDAGERGVVSVADVGAEVVHDVVIESSDEPADEGVLGGVVGCGGEDVVDAVFELVAAGGEVGGVDGVGGLEDERDAEAQVCASQG